MKILKFNELNENNSDGKLEEILDLKEGDIIKIQGLSEELDQDGPGNVVDRDDKLKLTSSPKLTDDGKEIIFDLEYPSGKEDTEHHPVSLLDDIYFYNW